MELIEGCWHFPNPIRLLSVTAINLTTAEETYEQVDLFSAGAQQSDKRQEKLEQTVDAIREKFGSAAINFGPKTGKLNKED
jgi:DNA polymerase-4